MNGDDFAQFPVWEFALDEEGEEEQDEATVRPFNGNTTRDPAEGGLLVKCSFRFADGTTSWGWLTPPYGEYTGVSSIQPTIFTENGHVRLYNGTFKPSEVELAESYRKLGRDASKTFPLNYRSEVDLVGGPVFGVLSGFSYLVMETGEVCTVA